MPKKGSKKHELFVTNAGGITVILTCKLYNSIVKSSVQTCSWHNFLKSCSLPSQTICESKSMESRKPEWR